MANADFETLVTRLCEEADIADLAGVLDDGLIEIDDTPMRLDWLAHSRELQVLFDFGPPTTPHAPTLHELMLEHAFDPDLSERAVFALHPASGHAVATRRVPLDALAAEASVLEALIGLRNRTLDEWLELCALALAAAPRPAAASQSEVAAAQQAPGVSGLWG